MAENETVMAAEPAETSPESQETVSSDSSRTKDRTGKKQPKKSKPGIFARMGRWFKDMKAELKKVQWPTAKQTTNNTLIVLAFCVVIGLCIFVFDKLADGVFTALINLFHKA